MKLRVRINKQTSRVDLQGAEPTVKELKDFIRETLLESNGLSSETEFGLSLNGSELLSDCSQTLSSCGIVSGDLICLVLPPSAAAAASGSSSSSSSGSNSPTKQKPNQQTVSVTTEQQPCSSSISPAAPTDFQESPDMELPNPPASVWDPMLCCEAEPGQAPLSLELLYHSAQICGPNDALVVAGHLLMLETGFIPQDSELRSGGMPAGWRSEAGVYKLQYLHPLCEGSVVTLAAVCMGPVFIINAMLKVGETVHTVHKLCLNSSSYVSNEWAGGSAAAAFTDLRKLSRVFKDQLAYPLITAARDAMALPVAFGLPALPPELLLRILRLLDVHSVVRLSAVSQHFHAATADSMLWKHLYCRDFSVPDSDSSRSRGTDWKKLYIKSYKLRCEHRRQTRQRFSTADLPTSIFVPPLPGLTPPIPGIIGGEYDQRPFLLPRPRIDPVTPFGDPYRRPRFDLRRPGPRGGRADNVRRGFI